MINTKQLETAARAIVKGHAQNLSILDDPLLTHAHDLTDEAQTILALLDEAKEARAQAEAFRLELQRRTEERDALGSAVRSYVNTYGPSVDEDEEIDGGDAVSGVAEFVQIFRAALNPQ